MASTVQPPVAERATPLPAPVAGAPRRADWPLLAATTSLYTSFGLIYGLMQGGLPPLMRARGIDLAAVGWFFIILVPFGLTFLWAPLIDVVRPTARAPRIAWIALMQGAIVALLLVVARGEAAPPPILLALGLGIAFAAATMDLALDALCTTSVAGAQRIAAGGLKVAALAIGSILGGGIFVALATRLGWSLSFHLCAAYCLLAVIPLLILRRREPPQLAGTPRRADLLAMLRRRDMRQRLALLSLASATMAALSFLNRVMLVDLHVPLARIGWIVGIGAPTCGLIASLLAIPSLRHLGTRRGMLVYAGLCLGAAAAMAIGAAGGGALPAIVGAIAVSGGTSGFFVIICAATLGWARGEQPATDYAVLYGVSRLVATLLLIVLTRLVPLLGWPLFYAGGAAAVIATCALLARVVPDRAG
jgi:MFS transporter, PAT family, beta-lactamase induction signal transducer AmpG